ncbi:DUF1824 family protein [Prochlorococcus marinus]|uniref:DUF1824 family protein n=1 Tax=Prochlorococcus marinus TaxID=1219 RepID=UPI0022B32645|nr:DUF1824 family protein [Prochlorococcus marinus]
MNEPEIQTLNDLEKLRSAPNLSHNQKKALHKELNEYIADADWFTIGIMASSSNLAILTLKEMENHFNWLAMKVVEKPQKNGPVFLKANQKTGDIYIRIEYGLGEGILLSCQHNDQLKSTQTLGPLPLNFFKK